MTTNLALEYIPRRMRELGYGDNYILRFRHFLIPAEGGLTVKAHAEYFILIEPNDFFRVESETGVFYSYEEQTEELQYEHSGEIVITSFAKVIVPVRFIQVIPMQKKQKCEVKNNCQHN